MRESCRACGREVKVQIQKNTGYCCVRCHEAEFAPHDALGRLDRSTCGLCGDAYVECSKCSVYLCDCTRSETCEGAP